MDNTCELCSQPIVYRVIQSCNHCNICLECYIRFSKIYHHDTCYFCQEKTESAPVIVTKENFTSYADAMKAHPLYDSIENVYYFTQDVEDYIGQLFKFTCPSCSMKFNAFDTLSDHLKCHRLKVCSICFNSGRFLQKETPIFSAREFEQHVKQHPVCVCCGKVFFDQSLLAFHMMEEHNRCEICAQQNKIFWCKDPVELVAHNEKCHFICHHPSCSSENLIAFATKGELLMHLQSVHHEKFVEIDFNEDFKVNDEDNYEMKSRKRLIELNRRFSKKLEKVFIGQEDKINRLKGIAKQYVTNVIDSNNFYNQFSQICGNKKSQIFTDMVAILPNPKKRAELLYLHEHPGSSEVNENQDKEKRKNNKPNRNNNPNKNNNPTPHVQPNQKPNRNNNNNKPNMNKSNNNNKNNNPTPHVQPNQKPSSNNNNNTNTVKNEEPNIKQNNEKRKQHTDRSINKKKKPQNKIILSF